jgi:hypothetical protein
MLQINPKKFKHIKNKSIPSPLRPKFRNKNESNIYFLSRRKFEGERKDEIIRKSKFIIFLIVVGISGYLLSN